jgi:hypothetical protein
MSYDPYASGSQPPQYESAEPMYDDLARIKGRVQAPAIALIVVAILNLLLVVFQVGRTILVAITSPQELVKERDEMLKQAEEGKLLPKGFLDSYKQQQQGQSAESFKNQSLAVGAIVSALWALTALLPLLGGIRMLSMRSYGLCIVGAISTAIPCLSCSGCCCLGEIIGIWALVVLASPEVRAAFH